MSYELLGHLEASDIAFDASRDVVEYLSRAHWGHMVLTGMTGVCILSSDLAAAIVRLCLRGSHHPRLLVWLVATFAVWAVLLRTLLSIWFPVRSLHALLLMRLELTIVAVAARLTLGCSRFAALLSTRLRQQGFAEVERRSGAWFAFDLAKAALSGTCFLKAHGQEIFGKGAARALLYGIFVLMHVAEVAWLLARSRLRPLPWSLAFLPVHSERAACPDEDCAEHDVCGICLESICTSAPLQADLPVSACRRAAGLSLCRLRPSLRVCASAARCALQEVAGGQLATLACGHRFHAPCLELATKHRPQCPTCRAALNGKQLTELSAREKCHVMLGMLFTVGFFYYNLRPGEFMAFASWTVISGLAFWLFRAWSTDGNYAGDG